MNVDEIIVGNHVSSLIKSYTDKTPIVIPRFVPPSIDMTYDFDFCVGSMTTRSWRESWYMLKFLCSLEGLVINSDDVETVRVSEDKISLGKLKVRYNKCHFFPGGNVRADLSVRKIVDADKFKIIDFMRLKFCDASKLVTVRPKGQSILKIESTSKRDIYAILSLKREQLTDFDYSDTMVRFYVQKVLLEAQGLVRPLIRKGSESRRVPKLEVLERKVVPLEETVYRSTRSVKYYDSKKRNDIIETHRRHHTSVEGAN